MLRGRFTLVSTIWNGAVRRLLARVHRYTLDRLRQEIEPVSASDFIRFLLDWQHLTPDRRVEGQAGLAGLLEQLEGFEVPAAAWEGEILPARMAEYDPAWLDALCLSGRWSWARLTLPKPGPRMARARGRFAPLPSRCFSDAICPCGINSGRQPKLGNCGGSSAAQAVDAALNEQGASFFADLVERSGLLRSQVEEALAELVANGSVTADSFTGLRALLTPSSKRPPLTEGKRRRSVAPYSSKMRAAGRSYCGSR